MSIDRVEQILGSFDTIHLEEMDRVQLMNRVDTKFIFSLDKLIEILPSLSEYYKVLEVNDVLLSEYESLYYDDNNLTLYTHHHQKRVDRYKVRYRKYVNSDIAFLEVKHKTKGRTDKSRIPSPSLPMQMSDEQATFVSEQGLNGTTLQPSLINGFHRITLVNKTENERLTLDLNLTFKWKDTTEKMTNLVIAELKQERVSRNSTFYALMKKNLIRPERLSKYCIGIITIYGKKSIKYNRFKKKLLKIKKYNKMLLNLLPLKSFSDMINLTWVDEDLYTLLLRMVVNLVFITIIIRYLYYPITKRKDYLFTYYLIGMITFFLCFGLKKLDIDTGMGLGLFAIFGIIRYRTDAIEIKEMTYLFVIIGLSVVNSLASNKISVAEMALINVSVVVLTYGLEYLWLVKHETRKTITYERIDLIKPEHYDEMMKDLQSRTGLAINRFEVGKINFLDDTAQVRIYYYADEQAFSDYHND